jgi:hypothetical protein
MKAEAELTSHTATCTSKGTLDSLRDEGSAGAHVQEDHRLFRGIATTSTSFHYY